MLAPSVDGLHRIGVGIPLNLPFVGKGEPYVPHPRNKERFWSKPDLPWMSIGYVTMLPPISTLTFYNAIANGGKMDRPRFVKAELKDGMVLREFPTEVIKERICKPSTLRDIQYCLEHVVSGGLGKKAGNGGNGAVSFHREKFVQNGGPDGGDGGNGGNVVFRVDKGTNTLLAYRYKHHFTAQNGGNGMPEKFHGANAEDLILPVPEGTVIKDAATGKVIHDMSENNGADYVCCRGGRGGWGNRHFATATRQAPQFAKNGTRGEEREVLMELKMIADVGLIGYPSVGKSSLLARISAARPKIADYHFTTLSPNLGVVSVPGGDGFVAADIPGLIDGAAEGAGLGPAPSRGGHLLLRGQRSH